MTHPLRGDKQWKICPAPPSPQVLPCPEASQWKYWMHPGARALLLPSPVSLRGVGDRVFPPCPPRPSSQSVNPALRCGQPPCPWSLALGGHLSGSGNAECHLRTPCSRHLRSPSPLSSLPDGLYKANRLPSSFNFSLHFFPQRCLHFHFFKASWDPGLPKQAWTFTTYYRNWVELTRNLYRSQYKTGTHSFCKQLRAFPLALSSQIRHMHCM